VSSPNGSVSQLEAEMRVCEPEQNYVRPLMPHTDPKGPTWASVLHLRNISVPTGSLIIGISLGGLVAAKLQETERPDLHVICISSPTHAEEVELAKRMEHRVALYSSADEVISGRTEKWPELKLRKACLHSLWCRMESGRSKAGGRREICVAGLHRQPRLRVRRLRERFT
jgi:hypothetical protein